MEQLIYSLANPLQPLASTAMVSGMAIVLMAIVWLVLTERRNQSAELPSKTERNSERPGSPWAWLVPL